MVVSQKHTWMSLSEKGKNKDVGQSKTPEGTFLVVQWLRFCAPNAGGWGFLNGKLDPARQNYGVFKAQLKIPHATMKTEDLQCCN